MKSLATVLAFFSMGSGWLWAQFEGGSGSGHSVTLLASTVACNEFFGGEGSGHDTSSRASTFNCIEFAGNSGSGATSVERKGQCVMYWGDSLSGYRSNALASTQNCIFFKGEDGSGYNQNTYLSPFVCPSFLSSGRDDGFGARSYTEDNGGTCYITVPIESSPLFGEVRNDDDGYLYWKTYSELNNDGFEVQKSLNAVEWEAIGWVAGAGNSTETLLYDFGDMNLDAEVQYYRFRQVDFDGTQSFSNIVALSLSQPNPAQYFVQVYPNPVIGDYPLHVQAWLPNALTMRVQVHNALGQLVSTHLFGFEAGNSQQSISTEKLPAGTYFLSAQTADTNLHWILPFVVVR